MSATIGQGCYVWQKVYTSHTASGNPRRIVMIYTLMHDEDATTNTAWIDTGFNRSPDWMKREWELEPMEVTPAVLGQLKKRGKEIGPSISEYLVSTRP